MEPNYAIVHYQVFHKGQLKTQGNFQSDYQSAGNLLANFRKYVANENGCTEDDVLIIGVFKL